MTALYGREWTRSELSRRIGHMGQVGGVRRSILTEGLEKGAEVIDFRTGTGFAFTVVPSRGMDLAGAEYRGVPLAWMSPAGIVAPEHFDPTGTGWLHSFFGGLLTTCGLTNVGSPCQDDDETLGLHGRISNIPARRVVTDARWEGSRYVLSAQGTMVEAVPSRYALSLTRNVTTKLGDNRLYISDIVENVGHTDAPFMFLYHINIGFPVLDEGAELVIPTQAVTPRDESAAQGLTERFRTRAPVAGMKEQVFYHDVIPDENRHIWVAVINRHFGEGQGIGVYVRYHKSQLPNFVQWKMMAEGTYVLGLEPANCRVEGRAEERARGTLQFIEAGGRRHFETEIGVLTNQEEIAAFEERVARIRSRKGHA